MTPFKPQDGDFETRVRESFARQAIMRTLNARLTKISPGIVEIEMPFDENHTQQHGFLHAGIVATILDSACGYAAYTLMPIDAAILTIEFKVNLLAPAKGEKFLVRGEVTKPGRTILVSDGRAYALTADGDVKLVATMTGTLMTVTGREGLSG
ncbi:MAG: PaaI family thioesterase [Phyllobacteriaceae bacterium]|nr:PaaI family thioesterase [Phyllobacteriaceae bacterium]